MSDRGITSRERRGPGPEPQRPAQGARCLLSTMRISMNAFGDEERGLQQAHPIQRLKVVKNGCVGALTMASSFGLFAAALGIWLIFQYRHEHLARKAMEKQQEAEWEAQGEA